jgi:hypothetical protein
MLEAGVEDEIEEEANGGGVKTGTNAFDCSGMCRDEGDGGAVAVVGESLGERRRECSKLLMRSYHVHLRRMPQVLKRCKRVRTGREQEKIHNTRSQQAYSMLIGMGLEIAMLKMITMRTRTVQQVKKMTR